MCRTWFSGVMVFLLPSVKPSWVGAISVCIGNSCLSVLWSTVVCTALLWIITAKFPETISSIQAQKWPWQSIHLSVSALKWKVYNTKQLLSHVCHRSVSSSCGATQLTLETRGRPIFSTHIHTQTHTEAFGLIDLPFLYTVSHSSPKKHFVIYASRADLMKRRHHLISRGNKTQRYCTLTGKHKHTEVYLRHSSTRHQEEHEVDHKKRIFAYMLSHSTKGMVSNQSKKWRSFVDSFLSPAAESRRR